MFDYVIQYLVEIVKILPACVFLRIILDACRNYIFKN